MTIMIKTRDETPAIGNAILEQVHALDPTIAPIYSLPLTTVVVERSLFLPRVAATLSTTFAFIAVTLAMVGVYGLISHIVEDRRKEIGIRMALGATSCSVVRIVLADILPLVAAGIAIGVALAAVLEPYATGVFAGIHIRDPRLYSLFSAMMFVSALAASLAPIRRATNVDPVKELK
jgi:ABC-type antimicrobial peptide transport system permease subunit